jgi:hypothetical protein
VIKHFKKIICATSELSKRKQTNLKIPLKSISGCDPNRPVELKRLFDHIADNNARRKYREPRRSSGQWTTMVEAPPLIDRTLNLDQSVAPLSDSHHY